MYKVLFTVLTMNLVWTTCPYVTLDGQFNPDRLLYINDVGDFGSLSDAVLYNSIAYAFDGSLSNQFSQTAGSFNPLEMFPKGDSINDADVP